jgi:3-isopropylmalate/(R)-2-methylmalate dehydratase large subunit
VDEAEVQPTVTWGTSPEHAIGIDEVIPDPDRVGDTAHGDAWKAALDYMGLELGRPIVGTKLDWVFIGSCTNSRLPDLREAARIVRGHKVAKGVNAWGVPGSHHIKREAEAEGLNRIFTEAGFEWREPGCSMCVAANGEPVPPGARCISTSNRNFVGRQGSGARTHLASPALHPRSHQAVRRVRSTRQHRRVAGCGFIGVIRRSRQPRSERKKQIDSIPRDNGLHFIDLDRLREAERAAVVF